MISVYEMYETKYDKYIIRLQERNVTFPVDNVLII